MDSFTYVIEPTGGEIVNFGILIPSDSILETISYYSALSPQLILTLYFKASVPPDVLGPVGADIVPQPDARFNFVLTPTTITTGQSFIAFTAMTNININNERLDITFRSSDGSAIPNSASGSLTLQFRNRLNPPNLRI